MQVPAAVHHVEKRHHLQVLDLLAVDPVEHLLEGAQGQVGGDHRHEQVVGGGEHAFRQRAERRRAVQQRQFVGFAERRDQFLEAVLAAAAFRQFDVRVAHADVGGHHVQVRPAGFALEAAHRLLALQQAAGLVARVVLVHAQVKAGGALRVEIPEQGAVFPAGRVPGHVHGRGCFTHPSFQVVKGDGLHGIQVPVSAVESGG